MMRKVARSEARKSQAKADEFLVSARADYTACRWTAAGLAAVHAGIAAGDAALVATTGTRSASQNHAALLDFLADAVGGAQSTQRRHLAGLLKMKNEVAYEQRLLTEVESAQLVEHAQRLVRWSGTVVDRHAG